MLFEIPSNTVKAALYLHKCFLNLTAKLNVLEVPRVIFVSNRNTNNSGLYVKLHPHIQ